MKGAIAVLLAIVLVGGMIVSPVCAVYEITAEPHGGSINAAQGKVYNLSIDVSPVGDAIQRIHVHVGTGTSVVFTLWYGNGSTVSGTMKYSNNGFLNQHSEVSIDSDVQSIDYIGLQEIGRIDIVGYARNWTTSTEYDTGFIVYDSVAGISDRRNMAYFPVSSLEDNVIYKFEITSSNPVAVAWYTNTRANVAKAAVTTPLQAVNEWVNFAISIAKDVYYLVTTLFYWIKFFFFDNLGMTVALYLSISMAYAAATSKNIFKFFGKFFNDQRKLFEFIIQLWRSLIEIVASFRGIFRI